LVAKINVEEEQAKEQFLRDSFFPFSFDFTLFEKIKISNLSSLKKSLDLNLNMKSIEILKIKIEISSNINF
jgi:hypothetical protein